MNAIAESHRTRIGCSKIAQALDLSRFGTAYQLWEQYAGRAEPPNISGQLRVALGEPMEDVLRPFVAARLGRELRRDRKEYVHPTLPLVGHVDYRASAVDGEVRPVVDMKTSLGFGARHRFGAAEDEVDNDVYLQMQGYCILTGAATAYVAALVPGPDLRIYTIAADADLQAMIADGIEQFWWHVKRDVPPPIRTTDDAARRWPQSVAAAIMASEQALDRIEDLRWAKNEIARLEKLCEPLEVALRAEIGDSEGLIDADGRPLCSWKSQTATRLDAARLKAEQPEIFSTYSKTTTSRVFRLAKEKA